MPRFSVCVDGDHLRAVDEIAADAGAQRSDVIRQAVEEFVAAHRALTCQESAYP